MNLYLIRHGKAETISSSGRDFDRKLSTEGKRKIEEICSKLKSLKIQIDSIYSSPLLRAKETADIFKRYFEPNSPVNIIQELSPGVDVQNLLKTISNETSNTALVGHEPDMSYILSDLCGKTNVKFKKGGIAKIVFEGKLQLSNGRLEFLVTPKLLK